MYVILSFISIALCLTTSHACWKPAADTRQPRIIRDTYICNAQTSKSQARGFFAQLKGYRRNSACAEHWWFGNLAGEYE